jgi:hypothetical protein
MAPCSAIRVPPRGRSRRLPSSNEEEPAHAHHRQLIINNESYAKTFEKGGLPLPPAGKLAVLACMDARLDPPRSSASRRATRT